MGKGFTETWYSREIKHYSTTLEDMRIWLISAACLEKTIGRIRGHPAVSCHLKRDCMRMQSKIFPGRWNMNRRTVRCGTGWVSLRTAPVSMNRRPVLLQKQRNLILRIQMHGLRLQHSSLMQGDLMRQSLPSVTLLSEIANHFCRS